jgi:DNA mismatch endonuclease (patch repair protein)
VHSDPVKHPSFNRRSSASAGASAAARGASKKADTKPEVLLRRALWRAGLRYRKNDASLPGTPDIVFKRARVAVFCDGDFWHGRDWSRRKAKLERGHNADYWIAKIERNIERDRENTGLLVTMGWTVLRVWESDIKARTDELAEKICALLSSRNKTEAQQRRSYRAAVGLSGA